MGDSHQREKQRAEENQQAAKSGSEKLISTELLTGPQPSAPPSTSPRKAGGLKPAAKVRGAETRAWGWGGEDAGQKLGLDKGEEKLNWVFCSFSEYPNQ